MAIGRRKTGHRYHNECRIRRVRGKGTGKGDGGNIIYSLRPLYSLQMYRREFSGRKTGRRVRKFEYVTRHGDIVEALRQWRGPSNVEHVGNDVFRDLFVATRNGGMTELYEVKTDTDRQRLYTAIGQLTARKGKARKGDREKGTAERGRREYYLFPPSPLSRSVPFISSPLSPKKIRTAADRSGARPNPCARGTSPCPAPASKCRKSVAKPGRMTRIFYNLLILWWARQDSNLGPRDYESPALTN